MKKYLLILFVLFCSAAMASPNKWVDEHGEVHYSDQLPSNKTKVEKLQFKDDGGGVPSVDNPYAPKSTKEMEADFQRAKAARDKEAKKEEQERAATATKQANCVAARSNLSAMQQSRRMFNTDENGERVYLDDAQKQQQIDAGQQAVNQYCN